MRISEDTFVSIAYELHVEDGGEQTFQERATASNPMNFIFGSGGVIPALEEKLKGLKAGDQFNFIIPPINGYGRYNHKNVMALPRSIFEINGRLDTELIKIGNTVQMLDTNDKRLNCTIVKIEKENITVDFNHPLAGKTLHFTGEVMDVRQPNVSDTDALGVEKFLSGCNDGCLGKCQGCGR